MAKQRRMNDVEIAEANYLVLQDFRLGRRSLRSADKFLGVQPTLVSKIKLVLLDMVERGLPMKVTDGLRTLAEQKALYAQGRTKPGRIVTYADGVPKSRGGKGVSNHQAKNDGFGHALDVTFINKQTGNVWWPTGGLWEDRWKLFGRVCVDHDLKWGGNWNRPDRPHVEF